jgi:polyisoprenoid-binding protein YceI
MSRVRLSTLVFTLCCATVAHAGDWFMDTGASSLGFMAHYDGQPSPGRFREFDTRLRFDPQRPEDGRLHVTVTLASVDMDSAEIDAAVRATEWLDVAHYARAEFDSTRITRTKQGAYVAHGKLRLKDVERAVAVPFTWLGSDRTATMTGQVDLKRTDFNIGTGEWADGGTIGLDVQVRFDVRLHRSD